MSDETQNAAAPADAAATPAAEEQAAPAAQPTPAPAPEKEAAAEVEVPKEFKDLVEKIEKMTVIELNSLVKLLEKKFGVSAVAAAAPAAAGPAAEEKSEYNVELTSAGDNKIAVIKAVKEVSGLGLKEAKDLVEAAPGMVKEGVKKEDAEAMKKKIEEAGGKVTLK